MCVVNDALFSIFGLQGFSYVALLSGNRCLFLTTCRWHRRVMIPTSGLDDLLRPFGFVGFLLKVCFILWRTFGSSLP